MKFAFSTLGVPGLPIPDVVALADRTGYQGVELRAHPEEPVHPGIGARERAAVVDEFKRHGVEILTVAGYARVAAEGGDEEELSRELDELIWLARDLGASYIRVFPGGGDQDPDTADATAARRLAAAAPLAAESGCGSCWRPTTPIARARTRCGCSVLSDTSRWVRSGT